MTIPDKYTYPILALFFLLPVAVVILYALVTEPLCPPGYVEVPVVGYTSNGAMYGATCAPAVKP